MQSGHPVSTAPSFFIIRNAENGGKTHLFITQPTTASSRRWQIWYCPAVSCLCCWPSHRMRRKMTDFDLVGRFLLYCTNRARHEVCWQAEDKQTTTVHSRDSGTLRTICLTFISRTWTKQMQHVGSLSYQRRYPLKSFGRGRHDHTTLKTSHLLLVS